MKKATLAAGIMTLGAFALSVDPAAATPGTTPKIIAHVAGTTSKNACTTWFTLNAPNCAGADLTGGLYPSLYWIYIAVVTPDFVPTAVGTTGLQFGISYQNGLIGGAADATGLDIYDWVLACATLEFTQPDPIWPNSGGGNLVTWATCQTTTELSPAGYFYVGAYGADTFRLVPRPVDGFAKTANCASSETIVPAGDLGFVAFGGAQGCNPCLVDCAPVPVEETTWGKVKSLYSN